MTEERLVRVIIRKFENTGIAEDDLFQEGMLALLKAKRTYQEQKGVKFETFASVVIRNHLIDIIRKRQSEPMIFDPDPVIDVGTETMPQENLKDLLRILRGVLNECSAIERAIFNAYFQGYSYQEICKIFGINAKKVDNTIQKIKKRVKSQYED